MYPDNILIWPDGFWCFREEFSSEFLRDNNYRVVEHSTDEWLRILSKRPQSQRLSPTKPDKNLH